MEDLKRKDLIASSGYACQLITQRSLLDEIERVSTPTDGLIRHLCSALMIPY